jgi:hypothetical protein
MNLLVTLDAGPEGEELLASRERQLSHYLRKWTTQWMQVNYQRFDP